MRQIKIPAAFMRGGTSNALVFHERDLPRDRTQWDELFLAATGSPDPYGRQLDGMGGGISSLSKVCIVGPATRPDADIDYTFGQVQIKEAKVDYSGNCGNMSSAIGPFAVEEGLVQVSDEQALVRIHNTNTRKIINARFVLEEGFPAVDGDLAIPGVAGTGSPVRLEFCDPGGATTGRLLPSGKVVDTLTVPGIGKIRASLVDAANACCFVHAADLGLCGTEMPEAIERSGELMDALEKIRREASIIMGIGKDDADAARKKTVPFIGFISGPRDAPLLSGGRLRSSEADLTGRMLASGQPHRALPLTASLCMAVAARIEGSVVNQAARSNPDPDALLRIAMPSGILTVAATVKNTGGAWHAEQGAFYRTQRRLFDGFVYVRGSRVPRRQAATG